jgi:uncharacterized membrane protein
MFKKNNLFLGILYGCAFPVIAWVVFSLLLKNSSFLDKPAAPYLIAIGLNLILLRFSAKAYLDKTSNGIMIATFACTLLVFLFKMHS